MSVGLAVIAKNEASRLPNLLASIEGAFDQVVLVDTGSVDRTVKVFKAWAETQENLKWTVEHFKWTKDFGAARAFAHSLLETDWEVWADCDDIIVGAQNLRAVAEQAPPNIAGYIAGYNYAQHPQTGACICYLKRERLVRRGFARWQNRVHEAQTIDGMVMGLDKSTVEWVHQKQASSMEQLAMEDARRNLDILDDWVRDEPDNSRVLAYLGTEYGARGDLDEAIWWFDRYLASDPHWDEERAQVHRKIGLLYLSRGEFETAIRHAMDAMLVMPQWTDSYITLAEAHYALGQHQKAAEWAREALRRGQPDTLLIVNPLDYTYQTRKILAGALAELKSLDEAIEVGMEALQLNPMDQELANALYLWRSQAKREHTANTVALLAQQLVAHDEQLKAMTLLEECVPHFAEDHQGVVQLRSQLRERLEWVHDPEALLKHYQSGGSKPEDFLPDEKLDEVPAALPRTQFLYAGIYDQLMVAHTNGLLEQALEEQLPAFMEALSGAPDPS